MKSPPTTTKVTRLATMRLFMTRPPSAASDEPFAAARREPRLSHWFARCARSPRRSEAVGRAAGVVQAGNGPHVDLGELHRDGLGQGIGELVEEVDQSAQ